MWISRKENNPLFLLLFLFLISSLGIGCAGLQPSPKYNRNRTTQPKKTTPDKKSETRKKKSNDKKKPSGGDALDREVSNWWGTPYAWGNNRKQHGVDCSAYVQSVFKTVYRINLPRTSGEQWRVGQSISRRDLRRGDLVFFNTQGNKVSHVGIYLGRNKFTHASNSDGVTIDSLKDSYYKKRYLGARRVK
jgi:cell wall-associated NlpC family hydrolase